jgi:carbon storage regulator CsrA
MLVLSRRENQKILFPNLGITVEIVGLKGNNVKLGIDAPPEIRVLRSELADPLESEAACEEGNASLEKLHERNNELNSIGLQIQIAQKLLKRGNNEQARNVLEGSLAKLQTLDGNLNPTSETKTTNTKHIKRTALLVEDDANERQLMATILQMCGFEVDIAADGLAAIEYLRTHQRPDCVLMDMQMPRMSGPEAIAKIRQEIELATVPIYGVSGLPRQEANVPIGDRGVTGWFAKPVDANKLVSQIFRDAENRESLTEPSLN